MLVISSTFHGISGLALSDWPEHFMPSFCTDLQTMRN